MKKTIALLLALVMVFALVACGGQDEPDPTPSAAPSQSGNADGGNTDGGNADGGEIDRSDLGPIKIGHLCDLTGGESMTGKEAQAAMDYAVKYIGKICGREIQVIHKDSQSDAAAAADAARQLVEEDEVCAIFGPTLIGHKGAVANYAANAEIPVIYYNPTPEMMIKDNMWVLGASGSTPQMPTVMADYVYKEMGYDKVVTLTKNDSGGTSYMDPFTANFTALGGEVLEQAWAPADTTDYAPYLMALADQKEADCMVAWTSANAAIQLWQEWFRLGLHETLPVVAVFHGAFTDTFVCKALNGINPELVEEILGTVAPMTWAYDMESEETKDFVDTYKKDNNGAWPIGNNLPGATVQALLLLKEAVEALDGECDDAEALRDALLAADITGPEGRTYFEEGTNIATKDVFVVKVVALDDTYHYSLVKAYNNVPAAGLTVG